MSELGTVAIAGAGDMARYFIDELLKDGRYRILLLSRSKREPFAQLDVDLRVTDYSQTSILSILDETNATSLFSFIHSDDPAFYNTVHESLLAACRSSKVCKRFAPSEYGGNITRFPDLPRFYGPTHGEFRKVLQAQNDVQWSLVNGGWFMDYFVEPEKTFMKPLPGVWPLDLTRRKALMLGTGDEEIGWTAARDVAKALVRLAGMPKWEQFTYLAGQIGTWKQAFEILEHFYGWSLEIRTKPRHVIDEEVRVGEQAESSGKVKVSQMDEWNVTGASAVPLTEASQQANTYFAGIKFRTISELLEDSRTLNIV